MATLAHSPEMMAPAFLKAFIERTKDELKRRVLAALEPEIEVACQKAVMDLKATIEHSRDFRDCAINIALIVQDPKHMT